MNKIRRISNKFSIIKNEAEERRYYFPLVGHSDLNKVEFNTRN